VHFDRLRVVSTLPPDGGWRAELAIERSSAPPRPVLLVRVPPAVAGDALALSMLARGVDLASRVEHPSLRRLLGTGEVEGDLVLVEVWRDGETLHGLLESGGPLTPELAARVAVDVAGALQACHTLPAAMGRPLCHGAVRAERVLLTESGEVLLCGMGRPFAEDATPQDDLRNLARLVLESLPAAGGDGPGPLAAVIDRVLVGEGYPSAAAFAAAVAAEVTPADAAAVVARVEASQPDGMPAWLSHRRALAQALREEDRGDSDEVEAPPEEAEDARAADAGQPSPERPEPGATASPSEAALAVAAPATTPPPFPTTVTAPISPVLERIEPQAEAPGSGGDQFVDVARAVAAAGPVPEAPSASPLAAWIDHPRGPLAVAAVLGLLGLLIGFALGGR
jgi:hypothetical protein